MFCENHHMRGTYLQQFLLSLGDYRIKRFAVCEYLSALHFLVERSLEQRP